MSKDMFVCLCHTKPVKKIQSRAETTLYTSPFCIYSRATGFGTNHLEHTKREIE